MNANANVCPCCGKDLRDNVKKGMNKANRVLHINACLKKRSKISAGIINFPKTVSKEERRDESGHAASNGEYFVQLLLQ